MSLNNPIQQRVLLEIMQTNLRHHNRVNTSSEARMTSITQVSVPGTIANISKAGLMIECNRQAIEDLIPREATPSPKTPVRLDVDFCLPQENGGLTNLHSICNIIHVRRKSREIYHIGVEFLAFPNDDYTIVQRYVDLRLQ